MNDVQREIRATDIDQTIAGSWRIIVRAPYGAPQDLSIFRGVPVSIGDWSFTDPYGPDKMTLEFPQVTIFDMRGVGDLDWAVKGTDVDVVWTGDLPPTYPFGIMRAGVWVPQWRWEGYITTFGWTSGATSNSMTVQIKGAAHQLDNYLAKPESIGRPMPYEWAIARQFLNKPSLRLSPLKITWPSWWTKTYVPGPLGTPNYKIPSGVTTGDNWTGMLTRTTGTWDVALTSYIQSLLAAMYSERGRWTIDLSANRQPVMYHQDIVTAVTNQTVVIDPVLPDNTFDLSEDWEQSLTTVFGQGTSTSGVTYSGMRISADGARTTYAPLAASRQVYPERTNNNWFDDQVMSKEVMVQMQTGLNADDAAVVGRAHLAMFSEPGITGTISIGVDPLINGMKVPRHLIRAGMQVHVPNLFGRPKGVLFHVSSSTHSFEKTTLTVDSKFRDALTVDEVRLRGKDALSVNRMLIGGQYEPILADQLFPWSYADGSGFIPSNNLHSAVPLFNGMPDEMTFPYEEWTVAHPPKDARWKNCYMRLGPRQNVANMNWITQSNWESSNAGIPIRMSQAGSVRLVQVAAYDADGHIMKVPFHISFYDVASVNVLSMPDIPANQQSLFPPYLAAQKYPFVRDATEKFTALGTKPDPKVPHPTDSVGLLRYYGTFYEKAGYFPGSYADGDAATGMLVDETAWSFDLTGISANTFNYYSESNLANNSAGQIYAMIYCDAQATQEVFFMGRIFRAEPGTGG